MLRKPSELLRALRSDRRGNAMIEFAVAAPVMILLYVGGYTLSDVIACNRKVTITARTIADLTTRYSSVTESDVQNILNVSTQVLTPYSAGNAAAGVAELQVTDATHAKVIWTRPVSDTSLVVNSSVVIPTSMAAVGTYMIMGRVTYTYTPNVKFTNTGTMKLADTILMLPRVSDQVPINP
jgi:Flp pilus assembly protein TadG